MNPDRHSRRRFVFSSLLVGTTGPQLWITSAARAAFEPPIAPDDPVKGGTLLDTLPFLGEATQKFGRLTGRCLSARQSLNLRTLSSSTLITPNKSFYVRTGRPKRLEEMNPWSVKVSGNEEGPSAVSVKSLVGDPREMGVHLLECSGNGVPYGLMSAAAWRGRPVLDALERAGVKADQGKRIRIGGYDDHTELRSSNSTLGASWIFTHAQLRETGAFFATHMNGVPLPKDHGYPMRLVVPGWYGKSVV